MMLPRGLRQIPCIIRQPVAVLSGLHASRLTHSSTAGSGSSVSTLTRAGVQEWARLNLGEDGEDVAKVFVKELINGAALLKLSEADLIKFGLKGGPRKNLIDAIAALKGTPVLAVEVPDKLQEPINLVAVSDDGEQCPMPVDSEEDFKVLVYTRGPVTMWKNGKKMGPIISWKHAVAAAHDPDTALHVGINLVDDVSNLKSWRYNLDTGLERELTMALVHDPRLKQYWPLEPLNDGRGVVFVRRGVDILQVDGILRNTDVLLVNEAKAAADKVHAIGGTVKGGSYVKGVRERAAEVAEYLRDPLVTTRPAAVMDELRAFYGKEVVPVLSARHATPAAVEACRDNKIHLLLPQGPGGILTL